MGIFILLFFFGVDNLFCGGCKDEGKISIVLNSGDCLKKFCYCLKILFIWLYFIWNIV